MLVLITALLCPQSDVTTVRTVNVSLDNNTVSTARTVVTSDWGHSGSPLLSDLGGGQKMS